MDTLTQKLLSGVIDDEDYLQNKQKLGRLRKEHEEQRDNQLDRGQKHNHALRFLELLKNLSGLYQMAKLHEKRQMIELCFSNRTVHQKTVELSTHSWLETVST